MTPPYQITTSDLEYAVELKKLVDEIVVMLEQKHHDYGARNLTRFGLFGILVRLSDKLARLENIIGNNLQAQVSDERIEDTFKDIIGYALQAILMLRGKLKEDL